MVKKEQTFSPSIWEDGGWNPLPSVDDDKRCKVCVIGLGGSGLACISELVRRGYDVIGIDAGSVAGGAAGKNGGFLLAGLAKFYHEAVKQHGREFVRTIYRQTTEEIIRMAEETPEAIRLTGSLRIAYNDEEYEDIKVHYEELRKDEFPVELYEGPEGKGILIPTDGVFNPLQRSRI